MKVGELIERLSVIDKDLEVVASTWNCVDDCYATHNVNTVEVGEDEEGNSPVVILD